MRDLFDLTGRVAVLTGASKGMGKVMVHALAARGATVVISSCKQDRLDAAAEINSEIGADRVHAVAANAGRKGDLEALIAQARELAGPIDIAIGNAGVNPHYGPISEIPDDAFEKIMTTNVQANLWFTRLVVPDMIEKGRGALVFTSSIGAFKPGARSVRYFEADASGTGAQSRTVIRAHRAFGPMRSVPGSCEPISPGSCGIRRKRRNARKARYRCAIWASRRISPGS